MQSNCGVDSVERSKAIPITMVESGPASGFWGAAELGRLIGEPDVLAVDIGGTTAKCSLIEGGHVRIVSDYWIERSRRSSGYPITVPVVDLVEIGSGGGSIAWVDGLRKLHVGPQSAGAVPGPAGYGRGGTHATTTDAHLALGRINPDYFCGGEVAADMDSVHGALAELAGKLGADVTDAARGIVRVANNDMINALKLVSVNRGYDPRDFTLVAFGGGGGMHASALAADLGIERAVIPRAADVFSAWGMLMSDLRRDLFVTRLLPLEDGSAGDLARLLDEVTAAAVEQFVAEGVSAGDVRVSRFGRLRYENQEHSVEVPLPDGAIDDEALSGIATAFHETYEREYTYRLHAPVELVGVHLVSVADVGKLEPAALPSTGLTAEDVRKPGRVVDFGPEGTHEAQVYDGTRLEPGMSFAGPAVVETSGTTIVVHPQDEATVDAYGNVVLTIGARESW
jgi:N-methylhydantoinase A